MTRTHWLRRARQEGTPLFDDDAVTFVCFADEEPILMGDFNLWGLGGTPYPALQQPAPGVWTYTTDFPPDAYIEYTFTRSPDDPHARLLDPYNQRLVSTGFGEYNGSFAMPLFPLPGKRPRRLLGQLACFNIASFMIGPGKRRLWLYQPPVEHPVPLLVVYDGQDYLYRAHLPYMLERLAYGGRCAPVALALLQNAGPHRFMEYAMSEALLVALLNDVLPLAQQYLNLLDPAQHPGAYGVAGASLGGLMALYTALRLPHLFGRVISQSGSYHLRPGEQASLLLENLWQSQGPLRIWQDTGVYEWLRDTNRQVSTLLKAAGHHLHYHEYHDGHNWTAWHRRLPDALTALFPAVS